MNNLKRIWTVYKLWILKKTANRLSKKWKQPYYIVKWKGEIILLSKSEFKYNRQRGLFPKSFNAVALKEISLYCTKSKNNDKNRI